MKIKIKLAILESDKGYLERLVGTFFVRYPDDLVIFSFTNLDIAMASLESAKIDVFLASDTFDVNIDLIPKRCSFAYLVESVDVDSLNGQRVVCKFQKADLIHKQILSLYAEKADSIGGFVGNSDCRMIAFESPCGGVGSSTMAAACALHFASLGRKTLYLNLESFGSTDIFFQGEGQSDMGDIIYFLASKKPNLMLKLESCARQTIGGLYFFAQPSTSTHMLEMTADYIKQMVKELRVSGSYEYIILDLDFGLDQERNEFLRQMNAVVWTSNGTRMANHKIESAYQALSNMEENQDLPLTKNMFIAYNRFSSNNGRHVENVEIEEIGGTPNFTDAESVDIIQRISQMNMFDRLA
ncbi:MAG: chromosome partitioning protein ParA [Lachnospiraceae bacterium]|nr:chromosome partitioning protein ParA [Lachnospiraceae bacterium]